jgi:hypothetical protein
VVWSGDGQVGVPGGSTGKSEDADAWCGIDRYHDLRLGEADADEQPRTWYEGPALGRLDDDAHGRHRGQSQGAEGGTGEVLKVDVDDLPVGPHHVHLINDPGGATGVDDDQLDCLPAGIDPSP